MQSRDQPREDVGRHPRAGSVIQLFSDKKGLESAAVGVLTVRELLTLLGKRIFTFAGSQIVSLGRVVVHLHSRLKNSGVRGVTAVAWERNIHRPFGDVRRLLPRRRWNFAFIGIILMVPMSYVAYCVVTIPFSGGAAVQTTSALVMEADDGRVFATRGIFKGAKIAPDRLPTVLASAVVAIEDRRFYKHGGIDLQATLRAAWHDLLGRRLEGGSTITQQLSRLLYLSPERSLKRKVQEAVLAIWLESHLTKQQILALYLNTAYFGAGTYGVDAAAKRYFGKSATEVSLSEAAMLAGLIRAPSALEPDRNMDAARDRADVVLDAMVKYGTISQQQANAARQKPAVLRVPPQAPSGSNYFIDAMANEVKSRVGDNAADLTIRTTLNRELQQIAEKVIAKRLATAGAAKNVHQAALVAMAPDGAILAMVGGRNYNSSQFNRAVQARRQPGSLFKLFVYLAAMRKGLNPETIFVDQPVQIGNWQPENYGDHYYGPVTLRTAFARSLNSVAVQLAETVGVKTVIDTAKRLGIQSKLPEVPSIALGSGDVTLLEMTSAFAAIAKNTNKVEPYMVRQVTQKNKNVFTRLAPQTAQADDPLIHSGMIDLLSGVVREGTGRAARLDQLVAGKTGTSQDYRDAWFVGFTPDLVVGVWVGNDDNVPMNGVTGGSLPATIWHDFVTDAEPIRRRSEDITVASRSPVTDSQSLSASAKVQNSDLRGTATFLANGMIEVQGVVMRLLDVNAFGRRNFYAFRRAFRGELVCTPAENKGLYACRDGDTGFLAAVVSTNDQFAPDHADVPSEQDHRIHSIRRHAFRHFWLRGFFH